jgi:hypothetical protein
VPEADPKEGALPPVCHEVPLFIEAGGGQGVGGPVTRWAKDNLPADCPA